MAQELRIPNDIDLAAFISREAHDLKSPFNSSLGFIKLVVEGYDDSISEQAKQDLTIAYQNTLYAVKIMESLIDIARLKHSESQPFQELQGLRSILEQTISEWTRKYHKKNPVDVNYSAPDVKIFADEFIIRQCFAHWISYVNEFVQESAIVDIQVEEQPEYCLFTIRSSGKKQHEPTECNLTMFGFAAKGALDIHLGNIIQIEEYANGAMVQFNLPKAC